MLYEIQCLNKKKRIPFYASIDYCDAQAATSSSSVQKLLRKYQVIL